MDAGPARGSKLPDHRDALLEATFDIHGELRTRLMIVSNCVYLVGRADLVSGRLSDRLEALALTHVNWVRTASGPAVYQHCHTLGLAVDVVGRFLRPADAAAGPY